jgi:hypothetical protein
MSPLLRFGYAVWLEDRKIVLGNFVGNFVENFVESPGLVTEFPTKFPTRVAKKVFPLLPTSIQWVPKVTF